MSCFGEGFILVDEFEDWNFCFFEGKLWEVFVIGWMCKFLGKICVINILDKIIVLVMKVVIRINVN